MWLISLHEVAEQIGKTDATTRVWLHRHCIRAAVQVSTIPRNAPHVMYDGALVKVHAAHEVVMCPGCTAARRGRGRTRASP